MQLSLPFRVRAFIIHLLISLAIACISMSMVFLVWYPAPLPKALGVTQVFLMMVAIDVVLGPLLTLLVAKPNKKTLKFDLAVIGLVQLLALVYGLYHIFIARPTYIAFDLMRFEIVQANAIPVEDKQKATPPYNQSHFFRPKWVAVTAPKDIAETNNRTFIEVQTGVASSMRPSLYETIDHQLPTIFAKAKPINMLYQYNDKQQVDNIIAKNSTATDFLPLKAPVVNMSVLLDRKNQKVLDIVDLRPQK